LFGGDPRLAGRLDPNEGMRGRLCVVEILQFAGTVTGTAIGHSMWCV